MDIILYSTGCPKCKILKKKLVEKNISFVENNSIEDMVFLGIDAVPVLYYDNRFMNFKTAIEWINKL